MTFRDFWHDHLRPFLVFSKGERSGALLLFLLLNLAWIIPVYLPRKTVALTDAEILLIDSARKAWSKAESEGKSYRSAENDQRGHGGFAAARLLFRPFDPNTADEQTWAAMGIPARTIRTIRRYVDRGGRFRTPDDLRKIYGLTDQQYRAMRAWIRIAPPPDNLAQRPGNVKDRGDTSSVETHQAGRSGRNYPKASDNRSRLDINEADSAAWESLPGIGPVLARRIVRYREALGGFHAVEQVAETFGLQDSVFQRIRSRLSSGTLRPVRPLLVNTADAATLATHPYISRKLAGLITAYRSRNGVFTAPEDLLAIPLVNDSVLNRLRPYLSFN